MLPEDAPRREGSHRVQPTQRKRQLRQSRSGLAVIATLGMLLFGACSVNTAGSTPETTGDLQSAAVERVVDGDTIIVRINGDRVRVRYIGIDTPETVKPDSPEECFGKAASAENERLVGGETVYLEADVDNTDDFDRLLRYVYIDSPTGGERIFVNAELVRGGFAEAVTFRPNTAHQDELNDAEDEARAAQRGMWASCDVSLATR